MGRVGREEERERETRDRRFRGGGRINGRRKVKEGRMRGEKDNGISGRERGRREVGGKEIPGRKGIEG